MNELIKVYNENQQKLFQEPNDMYTKKIEQECSIDKGVFKEETPIINNNPEYVLRPHRCDKK